MPHSLANFLFRWQRTKLHLLACTICLFSLGQFSSPLCAQHHDFQFYGVDDGLPDQTVSCLYQDSSRRIWLSTYRRVAIFNGYKFAVAPYIDTRHSQWIWQIQEGPKGKLWFLSQNAALYFVQKGKMVPHLANDTLSQLFGTYNNHSSFQFIDGDTVLMGFDNMPFSAKIAPDGKVQKIDLQEWRPKGGLLYYSNMGTGIFFGCIRGIKDGAPLSHVRINGQLFRIPSFVKHGRMKALELQNGKTLMSCGDRVLLFGENGLEKTLITGRQIISLAQSKDENIWLGYADGVACKTKDLNNTIHTLLPGEFCTSMIEDYEGNMWFGTAKGVFKLISRDFVHFDRSLKSSFSFESPPQFMGSDTSLLIKSSSGLFGIKGYDVTPIELNLVTKKPNGAKFEPMLISDRDGVYRKSGLDIVRITPKVNYSAILPDSNSTFWACSKGVLLKFDSVGNELFNSSKVALKWPENISQKFFKVPMFKDGQNRLWVTIGYDLYTLSGDSLTRVLKSYDRYKTINVRDAQLIDSVIWIATTNQGLWAFYRDTFSHFSVPKQFKSNFTHKIVRESKNIIWALGPLEMRRIAFSFKNKEMITEITSFDQDDGLKTVSAESGYWFNEKMWLSSQFGVTRFDHSSWKEREIPLPPIRLTKVAVNQEKREIAEYYDLSHDENDVQIHFLGITHVGTSRPKYRYRMLGSDSTWQITQDTFKQFAGLSPGNYEFQVLTVNGLDMVSDQPATVHLNISPPYWKTWWFILSIIVLAQVLTGSIIIVVNRLKRRALLSERATLEAEVKALRLQINPHFMFNALNNIRDLVSEGDQTDAPDQILRFAQLMRKILAASRKSKITLSDEVEMIRAYLDLAKTRFHNRIDYSINIEDQVKEIDEVINIPPLITQPIVENALIHGASKALGVGTVEINIAKVDQYIRYQIIDNGPGFSKNESTGPLRQGDNKSVGMSIIKEQIEKLNTNMERKIRFSILSGSSWKTGNGTCITIEFPID